MKKGMSEIFKYILVLVAGITILMFFISFGVNVSKTLKGVTASDVRETLNDYFNALSSAENLVTTADINSKAYVNYPGCGYIGINIDGTESSSVEYNHIIFSPSILNKKLYVWTLEWKYPFNAANFFYLIDPSTKIFFVGNDKAIDGIMKGMDNRFGVEKKALISQDFIKEQSSRYKNVIIVFFGQPAIQSGLANVKTRSIQAISCNEKDDDEECRGTVDFNGKQMFFAGKAMLYGAIFADDLKNYECGFNLAAKRLKLVSSVYDKKRLLLSRLRPECGKYSFGMNFDATSLEAMHSSMLGLKQSNKELSGDECTKLF